MDKSVCLPSRKAQANRASPSPLQPFIWLPTLKCFKLRGIDKECVMAKKLSQIIQNDSANLLTAALDFRCAKSRRLRLRPFPLLSAKMAGNRAPSLTTCRTRLSAGFEEQRRIP
ncbi:hypothetical protein [Chromobacterium phragmitis]|uniref:Uncharacterized protein n=1 Tax=Chromobacterium phragmitis TaxID=2202141 RepID=A0ABV0IQF7_9NEIS|nr:hypothetical protein [Chromobacterium phragmitis]